MNAPRPLQSPSAQIPATLVAQVLIDRDVATGVGRHTSLVQPEVVGVRAAANGEEHVRSDGFRRTLRAVNRHGHALVMPRKGDALCIRANGNALAFQDASDFEGDILVLARDQARRHLDDGHLGAKPPIHLRELEADIASAHDDEMPGHGVERQD